MGGLTSLASTAIKGITLANQMIGTVGGYRENTGQREYEQLKAQSDLSLKSTAERATIDKEQIRIAAETAESDRRSALRRAMARQRAKYGASGISAGDGSAQAVLLGLFDESEEEARQREAMDTLKTSAIDQNYNQIKRVNTLQLTQFKERNRLNKIQGQLGTIADTGRIIF